MRAYVDYRFALSLDDDNVDVDDFREALTDYMFAVHAHAHAASHPPVLPCLTGPSNGHRRYHSHKAKGSSEFALHHILKPLTYAYDPLCLCVIPCIVGSRI